MKLTIENFGPIGEAREIEVKPMTIFSGPSNTGKSYLATLVYATITTLLGREVDYMMYRAARRRKGPQKPLVSASDERQKVLDYFQLWAGALGEAWRDEASNCFGEEGENLLLDEGFRAVLEDPMGDLQIDLTDPTESQISGDALEVACKSLEEQLSSHVSEMDDVMYELRLLGEVLQQEFLQTLFGGVPAAAYYLPAIRGGIMQSQRALAHETARRASMAGVRPIRDVPLFSGVLVRFLQGLLEIRPEGGRDPFPPRWLGHRRSEGSGGKALQRIRSFGEEIEDRILSGKIKVVKSVTGGAPDFHYSYEERGGERSLALMSASSSVAELAPVVLYIKHYLRKGDYLILEEPEVCLHPEAQRDIARVLAGLANAGVKVLITTHSDIVLEQLSNCAQAAALQTNLADQLPAEKVACYQFCPQGDQKNRKVVVKEFIYDTESGFITDDHMEVATDLYNQGVDLGELQSRDGD